MTQDPPGAYEPQSQRHETPLPHDHDSLQAPRTSGGMMAIIVAALVIGAVVWWLFFAEPADETAPTTPATPVTTVAGLG